MTQVAEVRQNFLKHSCVIPNLQQDFTDWHHGRARYALWAVHLDVPEVHSQLLAAQTYLQPFLRSDYHRQPHITLAICGFPGACSRYEDDYTQYMFESDIAFLHESSLLPFEIEVHTLNSFASAPFLHVHDPEGTLSMLHGSLNRWRSDAHARYVPHVTVGLYAQQWPTSGLAKLLDRYQHPQVSTRHLIRRLSLMTYAAAEIGGRLATVADFDLITKQLIWQTSETIFV